MDNVSDGERDGTNPEQGCRAKHSWDVRKVQVGMESDLGRDLGPVSVLYCSENKALSFIPESRV